MNLPSLSGKLILPQLISSNKLAIVKQNGEPTVFLSEDTLASKNSILIYVLENKKYLLNKII